MAEPVRRAAELLNLDEKWLQEFDVEDPFNGNRLEGFLCRKPDHRYGALAIQFVNESHAEQRIFATPKLHYPFDKQGTFSFPAVSSIAIYDKLDGTNVLAYDYSDASGKRFTTFKLRLFPVLRNGKWGAFLDMWRTLMKQHPEIANATHVNGCAVSFELYGNQNEHLIEYDIPLACAALFGVESDGTVRSPRDLKLDGLPVAALHGEILAKDDPVKRYQAVRESLERNNISGADGKFRGSEGTVWYVTTKSNETVLFKCKPESIEAIHWAGGINRNAVMTTCWNVFESHDELTYSTLEPLLLEEYSQDEIDKFRPHIDRCVMIVNAQLAFERQVLTVYGQLGISIVDNKARVMRAMSKHFPRNRMAGVFRAIMKQEG